MANISLGLLRITGRQLPSRLPLVLTRGKQTIDYSHIPQLKEEDLIEQFVRGSGPGGSAVNKNSNCVVLKHTPTGVVVKCHMSRDLQDNRKMARNLLITKLDEIQNGERSVTAQKKESENKKNIEFTRRRKKLELLKSMWKKREGVD